MDDSVIFKVILIIWALLAVYTITEQIWKKAKEFWNWIKQNG